MSEYKRTESSDVAASVENKLNSAIPPWAIATCAVMFAFAMTVRIIGIDISGPINTIFRAKASLIEARATLVASAPETQRKMETLQRELTEAKKAKIIEPLPSIQAEVVEVPQEIEADTENDKEIAALENKLNALLIEAEADKIEQALLYERLKALEKDSHSY